MKRIFEAAGITLLFWQEVVFLVVAISCVTFVIELVLHKLNRSLLEWRKARGRDIEVEERYESDRIDHGMISLRPKDETDDRFESFSASRGTGLLTQRRKDRKGT